MPKAQFFAECLADEDILYMLMVPCTEGRGADLQPIECMPFQCFDQLGCVGRTGSLDRLKNLYHRGVAEVAS